MLVPLTKPNIVVKTVEGRYPCGFCYTCSHVIENPCPLSMGVFEHHVCKDTKTLKFDTHYYDIARELCKYSSRFKRLYTAACAIKYPAGEDEKRALIIKCVDTETPSEAPNTPPPAAVDVESAMLMDPDCKDAFGVDPDDDEPPPFMVRVGRYLRGIKGTAIRLQKQIDVLKTREQDLLHELELAQCKTREQQMDHETQLKNLADYYTRQLAAANRDILSHSCE